VVADGSGRKIEDGVDQDDTASTTPPSATTIPLPWVPINIQPQQQSTAGGGSHASAEADATIDTDLDATAKPTSSTVALPPAGTTAPATAAATDPAAAAAAGVGGIQLGVAGMSVPGANRQAAPDKTAQPAVGALADAAADGSAATPLGDATGGRKGGDVASFADALKPALGATAADTGQPAATPVGAVDAGRSHAPTRSYLDVNNATAAAATVPVPVGSNGWTDAVVDKVMWFSANQINSAEIKLNPPDLGPLHVRISTQQDQTSVVFSSPHAAVRDALDQALPRLRDMFGGQGLQLSDASVGGQAQRQQQDAQQQSARQGQASGWFGAEDSGDTPVAVTRVNGSRLSTSAVDAYA
jgi:flagellar hook-length control protein FliK